MFLSIKHNDYQIEKWTHKGVQGKKVSLFKLLTKY